MNVDWEMIVGTNDEDLINTISMCCPFDVNEKSSVRSHLFRSKKRFHILIHMNLNKNNMGSRYVS